MKFEFRRFQNLGREELLSLLAIRNQEYVRENMYDQSPISAESHLKWVSGLGERSDCIYWAIVVDGQIAGCIDLTSIDQSSSFAEWGYYISKEYFGIGAIVEYLGLDHFMSMGFARIKAGVKETNMQVFRMHVDKFGFKPCSEFSCEIDGVKYLGASLTADDWHAKHADLKKKMSIVLKRATISWE